MNATHYEEKTVLVPIERPTPAQLRRHGQYTLGRLHRAKGLPCMSANGAYLDGWYSSPGSDFYFITAKQAQAFGV
jgi:hypothetical protein